ncbi:MAG TPA: lanthionine synthetase C family protein, partial [Candidatus Baltobacteraceae bacterium]|nr:lanthionine synthetase C family protein [Candidatus Baltobacteraceae bacterium]
MPDESPYWSQSLAEGAAGIALLHIERARAGLASWSTVHTWLTSAVSIKVSAASDVGLYVGAPAVAYALQAAADQPGKYERALRKLDEYIVLLTDRMVCQAHARIDRGDLPSVKEFDLIYGLSGIGAFLLRRHPRSGSLEQILSYLVRLTYPLNCDGDLLPGWWAGHDPFLTPSSVNSSGHGNLGMAHGISGPLALLSLAKCHGITVDGQSDAIERICVWLDTWRQDGDRGWWWPQWVTR